MAKIQGVQDVENAIETLPVAQSDRRIRLSIGRQLEVNIHFERTMRMRHPPFRIVVKNGHVGLFGYVQGDAEMIEIQRVVGQTQGVLRVENQLQTIQ